VSIKVSTVNALQGEAYIIVHGSPFDQCDGSGQGSCADYDVGLTILPASPQKPPHERSRRGSRADAHKLRSVDFPPNARS